MNTQKAVIDCPSEEQDLSKNIDYEHPFRERLGVDYETLDRFEVGYYTGRGQYNNSLIAPIRSPSSDIIAYMKFDTSDPENVVLVYPLADEGEFDLSDFLYNEQRIRKYRETRESELGCATSPLTVIKLASQGVNDVVAFFDDYPSARQCTMIESLVSSYDYKRAVYYTDNMIRIPFE